MSKGAELYAETLSAAELSVLLRMEADYGIAPGAWTVVEYEIIERSSRLYRPIFVSRGKDFGHTLTGFGKRVQVAAQAIEARRAATGNTDAVADESAVPEGDVPQ